MTPCTNEVDQTIGRIIFRVDVKVCNLFYITTSRVSGDTADIVHAKTSCVVGLVDKTIKDILIVVDGLLLGLVQTCIDWLFEIADVKDVGHRELISSRSGAVSLVELIVKDNVFLPVAIENSTLVGVLSTDIRGARDDTRSILAGLVSHVVDGESILVIAIADIASEVALVGATVDEALGIVHIAVLTCAARGCRPSDIAEIDEGEASTACTVARSSTDRYSIAKFFVDNNVVRATNGQISEESSDICRGTEVLWTSGVDFEKLVHVKDLDTMTASFGSDDHVVLERTNLPPDGEDGLLGKATQVGKLAVLVDLGKCSTICLSNGDKLPTIGCDPAPR
jgi:hypothetical protein